MDDKKRLGYKLIHMRTLKNMTQAQLAESVGMARENYARYEAGKVEPRAFVLRDICKVLNVSVDYMLGMVEE